MCGPCALREQVCSYQGLETPSTSHSTPDTSGNVLSPKAHTPHQEVQADRLLELKLLHHFSTEIPEACTNHETDIYYLRKAIPNFALSHPFLLDVLFAVSALHLEYLEPNGSKWLQIALSYQQRALAGFNKALSNVTEENCPAIAICSMFVALISIALPGLSDKSTESDPSSEIMALRNMLQGPQAIMVQWGKTLMKGDLGLYFQRIFEPCLQEGKHRYGRIPASRRAIQSNFTYRNGSSEEASAYQ